MCHDIAEMRIVAGTSAIDSRRFDARNRRIAQRCRRVSANGTAPGQSHRDAIRNRSDSLQRPVVFRRGFMAGRRDIALLRLGKIGVRLRRQWCRSRRLRGRAALQWFSVAIFFVRHSDPASVAAAEPPTPARRIRASFDRAGQPAQTPMPDDDVQAFCRCRGAPVSGAPRSKGSTAPVASASAPLSGFRRRVGTATT
jgi:hypothetical protein